MLQIVPLCLGHMANAAGMFVTGRSGSIRYPVPGYAVVHDRGVVLFDTGLHATLMDSNDELLDLAPLFTVELADADLADRRLDAQGIPVAAVTHVVNSHLHFDHCGHNAPFAHATTLVQRAEWDALAGRDSITYAGTPVDEIAAGRLELLDGAHDVFGDDSVVCVPTPGHTAGHQSLLVTAADGTAALLVADACYLGEMLADDLLPPFGHDPDEQRRSYATLREHAARGVHLLHSHDVGNWDAVPPSLAAPSPA